MTATSKGVWLDTASGKVVETEPTEGVQLAAPGTEITPAVQAAIDAAREAAPAERAVAPKAKEKR